VGLLKGPDVSMEIHLKVGWYSELQEEEICKVSPLSYGGISIEKCIWHYLYGCRRTRRALKSLKKS